MIEVELPRHRVGVIAVRPLNQQQIAELAGIAEEGERVLAALNIGEPCLHLARVRIPEARLAEQVEPDVGERDVLLQYRPVPDPLAESLRQHEWTVAESQEIVEELTVAAHVRCA